MSENTQMTLREAVGRAIYEMAFEDEYGYGEAVERAPEVMETVLRIGDAAIRTVRAYDLAVGPSEAEIDAAGDEVMGADWCRPGFEQWDTEKMRSGLRAAAAERAMVAEEVAG